MAAAGTISKTALSGNCQWSAQPLMKLLQARQQADRFRHDRDRGLCQERQGNTFSQSNGQSQAHNSGFTNQQPTKASGTDITGVPAEAGKIDCHVFGNNRKRLLANQAPDGLDKLAPQRRP